MPLDPDVNSSAPVTNDEHRAEHGDPPRPTAPLNKGSATAGLPSPFHDGDDPAGWLRDYADRVRPLGDVGFKLARILEAVRRGVLERERKRDLDVEFLEDEIRGLKDEDEQRERWRQRG
jgi:hypothetical protein